MFNVGTIYLGIKEQMGIESLVIGLPGQYKILLLLVLRLVHNVQLAGICWVGKVICL